MNLYVGWKLSEKVQTQIERSDEEKISWKESSEDGQQSFVGLAHSTVTSLKLLLNLRPLHSTCSM